MNDRVALALSMFWVVFLGLLLTVGNFDGAWERLTWVLFYFWTAWSAAWLVIVVLRSDRRSIDTEAADELARAVDENPEMLVDGKLRG